MEGIPLLQKIKNSITPQKAKVRGPLPIFRIMVTETHNLQF